MVASKRFRVLFFNIENLLKFLKKQSIKTENRYHICHRFIFNISLWCWNRHIIIPLWRLVYIFPREIYRLSFTVLLNIVAFIHANSGNGFFQVLFKTISNSRSNNYYTSSCLERVFSLWLGLLHVLILIMNFTNSELDKLGHHNVVFLNQVKEEHKDDVNKIVKTMLNHPAYGNDE